MFAPKTTTLTLISLKLHQVQGEQYRRRIEQFSADKTLFLRIVAIVTLGFRNPKVMPPTYFF